MTLPPSRTTRGISPKRLRSLAGPRAWWRESWQRLAFVTGKNSPQLHAASSLILNAVKVLAGILEALGVPPGKIVVMPNGRALPDDRAPAEIYSPEHAAGFAKFERDLLDCLIPAVEALLATSTVPKEVGKLQYEMRWPLPRARYSRAFMPSSGFS